MNHVLACTSGMGLKWPAYMRALNLKAHFPPSLPPPHVPHLKGSCLHFSFLTLYPDLQELPGERWPLFLDSISFCLSDTDLA
jgi:hypothetical protein